MVVSLFFDYLRGQIVDRPNKILRFKLLRFPSQPKITYLHNILNNPTITSLNIRIFSSLISLWVIPFSWVYFIAYKICAIILLASFSLYRIFYFSLVIKLDYEYYKISLRLPSLLNIWYRETMWGWDSCRWIFIYWNKSSLWLSRADLVIIFCAYSDRVFSSSTR